MRHLAVLASFAFLAACPADDAEPPAPPAPETPLSELSEEEMWTMCNDLVVAEDKQLVRAYEVVSCVERQPLGECDAAEVDTCIANLPDNFPTHASCALSEDTIEDLQACPEVTFAELRECLEKRVALNLQAVTELSCTTVDQFEDSYFASCDAQRERCPGIDFNFLRVQ